MGQHVGIAKAAHMLGVDRHDLQRMIRSGELHTFEGEVDLDELRHHYPTMALDESMMVERVKLIRGAAFGRRVRERVMPETDELEIRLHKRDVALGVANGQIRKYRGCIEELAQLMGDLNRDASPEQKETLAIINSWLLDKLENSE
jgi:CDP-4-dehydro-6-deoxyglucose reductase